MKLTERELWLMAEAFETGKLNEFQCTFEEWLADLSHYGVTNAEALPHDAPPDTATQAAVVAEREACAAVCDEHARCFYLSVWDDCAKSCAEEIRARLSP